MKEIIFKGLATRLDRRQFLQLSGAALALRLPTFGFESQAGAELTRREAAILANEARGLIGYADTDGYGASRVGLGDHGYVPIMRVTEGVPSQPIVGPDGRPINTSVYIPAGPESFLKIAAETGSYPDSLAKLNHSDINRVVPAGRGISIPRAPKHFSQEGGVQVAVLGNPGFEVPEADLVASWGLQLGLVPETKLNIGVVPIADFVETQGKQLARPEDYAWKTRTAFTGWPGYGSHNVFIYPDLACRFEEPEYRVHNFKRAVAWASVASQGAEPQPLQVEDLARSLQA